MANTAELDSNVSASTNVRDARGFYNSTQDRGLDHRGESKIFYMRNFNNWTKSTLIDSYLQRIRTEQPDRSNEIHVFDMGCGKGGDIPKWLVGRVKFVAFGDIAENSVEDCRRRHRERNCKFGAEFFAIDCTKELVRDKLKTSEPCFDLVSTQFVIHYSFDKYASANRFLRNAAEFLRIGGYFIGTTVNSCDLVERCRNAPDQCISNDVFSIRFDSSIDLSKTSDEPIPLFGAKYHFTLDELVDCPEYLVYFPLLEQLAKEHGLERVERETFHDYFNKNKDSIQSRFLQKKMTALEYYELPKDDQGGQQSLRLDPSQYAHAEKYLTEEIEENPNSARCCRTLSKQEWEITSLYIIFAFKKVREVKYDGDADTNH